MKCEDCDRPVASAKQWKTVAPGGRPDLCWGGCEPIDWRARAIAAEKVVEEARKRCNGAVPQWAPELRAALAEYDRRPR